MESTTLATLTVAAASLGLLHTLAGPDHYLPFVAMARIGRWSTPKTLVVTILCGLGHVLSSIVVGLVGIALGITVTALEWLEDWRGSLAGWLLLGFGLAYTAWGVRQAIRNRPHTHVHVHADGAVHAHDHGHAGGHAHVHAEQAQSGTMTPWILFTIFVFGPCEPLIPMLMYPAAQRSTWGVVLVASVFSVVTIATMSVVVLLAHLGLARLAVARLERCGHAVAGLIVTACGLAIKLGF